MRRKKWIPAIVLALAAAIVLTGCGAKQWLLMGGGDCNDTAELEWGDFVILNDITYMANSEGTKEVTAAQQGDKVGEVSYMLDEHACANHKQRNGDAAYLPVGTDLYAMKGYRSSYRVMAAGKVYEAQRNPHAKTLGDLWDIAGKITNVSLESGMDGSPIGSFMIESSVMFAKLLPTLPVVGWDTIDKNHKPEYGIFLRVYLRDGTSFRIVYYEKMNAFTAGAYGTEGLKTIIVFERARIKRMAGL